MTRFAQAVVQCEVLEWCRAEVLLTFSDRLYHRVNVSVPRRKLILVLLLVLLTWCMALAWKRVFIRTECSESNFLYFLASTRQTNMRKINS